MNGNIAIIADERNKLINYNYFLRHNLNIYLFNSASLFLKENNILHFNLIVLDIVMIDMTGIEFLKRMFDKNEVYRQIPILFFSELAKDKRVCKMLSNVIDCFSIGFLEKPIDDKMFLASVIDIVKNKNIGNYNKFKYKKALLQDFNLELNNIQEEVKIINN